MSLSVSSLGVGTFYQKKVEKVILSLADTGLLSWLWGHPVRTILLATTLCQVGYLLLSSYRINLKNFVLGEIVDL